ncbi:MAG: CocE/NonD family hydrolase [Pseudomonadota bacterium]
MSRAFGEMPGPERERWSGYVRQSFYVAVRDGTKLAMDLFRPSGTDGAMAQNTPVILTMTPYNRANLVDGHLTHALSDYVAEDGTAFTNDLRELVRHGYAYAVVDVRGQGASFGQYVGCMSAEEGRDGHDLVQWLAEQDWCSGAVGMDGSSYGAATQFLTAAERPPALKAMFAAHIYFDGFDVFFPGGVRVLSLPAEWGSMVDQLAGRTAPSTVAPVDADEDGAHLAAAIAEHKAGRHAEEIFREIYASPYRDGNPFFTERRETGSQNLLTTLPRLQEQAPPAYFWGGFNDYFPDQMLKWHANWTAAPAKLALGPWTHSPRTFTSPRDEEDLRLRAAESLRWFDRFLMGEETGVTNDASIHYAVQDGHRYREGGFETDEDRWTWQETEAWPPSRTPALNFQLCEDKLSHNCDTQWARTLNVDPTTSTGPRNRMNASFKFQSLLYPDMAEVDRKSLAWTSDPLVKEVVIAATPRLTFEAEVADPNTLFVVWMHMVDKSGRSSLLSYASLKAAYNEQTEAPYSTVGMIYRPSEKDGVMSQSQRPGRALYTIDLLPVANRFEPGTRIRVTLSGADAAFVETPPPHSRYTVFSGNLHL